MVKLEFIVVRKTTIRKTLHELVDEDVLGESSKSLAKSIMFNNSQSKGALKINTIEIEAIVVKYHI